MKRHRGATPWGMGCDNEPMTTEDTGTGPAPDSFDAFVATFAGDDPTIPDTPNPNALRQLFEERELLKNGVVVDLDEE